MFTISISHILKAFSPLFLTDETADKLSAKCCQEPKRIVLVGRVPAGHPGNTAIHLNMGSKHSLLVFKQKALAISLDAPQVKWALEK